MKQLLICAHFSPGSAPANIWALVSGGSFWTSGTMKSMLIDYRPVLRE
ncbi:hypothetical protein [Pseudomonas syringae]|nr:hypothetical protein [Pseudomonas syringae]